MSKKNNVENYEVQGTKNYTQSEILNILLESVKYGSIDLESMQQENKMIKREEILKKHSNKIWQGTDKKWRTYLLDVDNKRKMVKRNTRKEVEDIIIDHFA